MLFTPDYFEAHRKGALSSAEVILGELRRLLSFDSVLDMGCGHGYWLAIARQLGCARTQGIDGPWIDVEGLEFPGENFLCADLGTEIALEPPFDLVLCLEVAQYLPPDAGDMLVGNAIRSGEIVLFSSAVPGQNPGEDRNPQWQTYWCDSFEQKGWLASDFLQRRWWRDTRVEWWYRQNLFLTVSHTALRRYPELATYFESTYRPRDIIHPETTAYTTEK